VSESTLGEILAENRDINFSFVVTRTASTLPQYMAVHQCLMPCRNLITFLYISIAPAQLVVSKRCAPGQWLLFLVGLGLDCCSEGA
jgi:hypothetical protein